MQCSALFNNIATPSILTGIGCNDIFEHNYFLCKQTIVEDDSCIQQNTSTVKTWYLCPRPMIFVTGYFWYIKPAMQGLTKYPMINFDQPNIGSF